MQLNWRILTPGEILVKDSTQVPAANTGEDKRITPKIIKKNYSELLDDVRMLLSKKYPDLVNEELTIVADLMCRNDEDIVKIGDQFYQKSKE